MDDYAGYGDGGNTYGGYDAGGGYQSKNQAFGGGPSPDKGGRGTRDPSTQTITPVTGAIFAQSPMNDSDDSITVNGKQVSKVVVCGRVTGVDFKETYTEYTIDDGSGLIKCIKMTDEVPQADEQIPMHAYMKGFGAIRKLDNERKVNCHSVRMLKDHNEFTHHMLAVLYNQYLISRGPLSSANPGASSGFGGPTKTPGFSSGSSAGHMDPSFNAAVDRDSKSVHDVIARDDTTDAGPSVDEIARATNLPVPKVQQICNTLTAEGYLYSTIDDLHFKSTGSLV